VPAHRQCGGASRWAGRSVRGCNVVLSRDARLAVYLEVVLVAGCKYRPIFLLSSGCLRADCPACSCTGVDDG